MVSDKDSVTKVEIVVSAGLLSLDRVSCLAVLLPVAMLGTIKLSLAHLSEFEPVCSVE